jgi:MoxR-like ATPase
MADALRDLLPQLKAQLGKVILGKSEALDQLLIGLLSASNVLLEDVPGVGKTTLAKALARSFAGDFKRVQFTPDLLPTDITGSSVYNPQDGSFTFKEGPVFCNILLADEINRASPRTQSALLEAMSERQVSIEGRTTALPSPFLVIATQNPVEYHGTYPLPEAQLDRFGLRLALGYPALEHEVDVLFSQTHHHPLDDLQPVIEPRGILDMQAAVRAMRVERSVGRYIVALADATRHHVSLKTGCSPRGALALFRIAQARAYLEGRDYVVPEDVKTQAVPALAHRLALDTKARYAGVQKEDVVRQILDQVPVGV